MTAPLIVYLSYGVSPANARELRYSIETLLPEIGGERERVVVYTDGPDRFRDLGVVTVDDVLDVIEEEQTEDVQKLGGMEALDEPYMQIGFLRMLGKRAGWLSILFVGEMLTASATARFQGELERTVILSLLMPGFK